MWILPLMDEKNYKFGPRKKALSLSATPFINKGLVEPILVYLFIYFIYFFSVGRYTCERVAGIFWWQWTFSRVFRWSTEVPERSAAIELHRKWIKLFRFCCCCSWRRKRLVDKHNARWRVIFKCTQAHFQTSNRWYNNNQSLKSPKLPHFRNVSYLPWD